MDDGKVSKVAFADLPVPVVPQIASHAASARDPRPVQTSNSDFWMRVQRSNRGLELQVDFRSCHPVEGSAETRKAQAVCRETRDAAARTDALVVWPTVEVQRGVVPLGTAEGLIWCLQLAAAPPLAGRTEDLILTTLHNEDCPTLGADTFLRCLAAAVGAAHVRRIHVLPKDWEEEHSAPIFSASTGRRFWFETELNADGNRTDQLSIDWHLQSVFDGIASAASAAPSAAAAPTATTEDTFNANGAIVFAIQPRGGSLGTRANLLYGEITRHYRDGRTLVHEGLETTLRDGFGYPSATTRKLLRSAAALCAAAFPNVEYISILAEMERANGQGVWRSGFA